MIEVQNPYKKEALIKAFEVTHSEIKNYFTSLPVDAFFKKPPDKWSPSENLVHLIKSIKAVSIGMKMPKIILGFKFGKSKRSSRLYPQIREAYLKKLAEGAKSIQKFNPENQQQTTDLKSQRKQLLTKWDEVHQELISVVNRWEEKDLDKYVLPHPILGNLTIREMIMFTIYHNIHHLTNVQKSIVKSQD